MEEVVDKKRKRDDLGAKGKKVKEAADKKARGEKAGDDSGLYKKK